MKDWNLNIKVSVSNNWIKDGFDLQERVQQIEDFIHGLLPYAYEHEVKIVSNCIEIKK